MDTGKKDRKNYMLILGILLVLAIGVGGIVVIIISQQQNSVTNRPRGTQYICVPVPVGVNPPPSTPPTKQTRTPTYTDQGTPICPPGFVPQPIGTSAPKGMPRP